jgi:hypothetical protein
MQFPIEVAGFCFAHIDSGHSLRRHYPDQVLGVDGNVTVLSAGISQLPRYLLPKRTSLRDLALTSR